MTKEITIKCKKCGHELPPGSVFCDNCGAKIAVTKNEAARPAETAGGAAKKAILIVAVCVIAVIAFLMIRGTSIGSKKEAIEEEYVSVYTQLDSMKSRVTPEQYEALEFGMTYDEVVAFLGEEGASDFGNNYAWPGEYYDPNNYICDYAVLWLVFSDNLKLIEIKETNILCGKEIFEAYNEGRESEVTVTEEDLASLKNRMSYEEFVEILGAEGVLKGAESDKSGYDKKTYEWRYYIKGDKSERGIYMHVNFHNGKARKNAWDTWGE